MIPPLRTIFITIFDLLPSHHFIVTIILSLNSLRKLHNTVSTSIIPLYLHHLNISLRSRLTGALKIDCWTLKLRPTASQCALYLLRRKRGHSKRSCTREVSSLVIIIIMISIMVSWTYLLSTPSDAVHYPYIHYISFSLYSYSASLLGNWLRYTKSSLINNWLTLHYWIIPHVIRSHSAGGKKEMWRCWGIIQ